MPADYLLFTFGNAFDKSYIFAKKIEGNPNPYAGAMAGGHYDILTLVRVLIHGTKARFDPESVATIDQSLNGIYDGIKVEPVDGQVLEAFKRYYRIELANASVNSQFWAKSAKNN